MNASSIPQKRCKICGEPFPATAEFFYTHKLLKDGLANECKTCAKAKANKWAKDNPERLSERNRKWRSDNLERDRENKRKYQQDHLNEHADAGKKYYQAHTDKARTSTKNWEKNNPDKVREKGKRNANNRRTRKLGLPLEFSANDWDRCLEYFDHKCAACGRPRGLFHTLAMDHWIPLSDPRPDNPGTVPTNIVPLCHGEGGCNNRKNDRDPVSWCVETFGEKRGEAILKRVQEYFDAVKSLPR